MRFTYPSGARALAGYTIKRGIGVGGFGEVYFAVSDAGKEVAIKRIQRNLEIELRGVRQCLNMKHVNLISLWDIRASEEGETWVVMEYVPGYSLRDALERHPQGLPETEVRTWITSIAAGVNYLHDRGIVHRDLKPGNVFYDTDSHVVKIGDYGLAKFISCSRRSGHTESVGTFHYMAPEIGRGIYGKEIDIYAIGVMFYEVLCGEPPFDGETTHEIILKHLTADPDLDRVPHAFRQVIGRCLQKDPTDRYSSVAQMLADTPWGVQVAAGLGPTAQGVSIDAGGRHVSADSPTQVMTQPSPNRTAAEQGPLVIDESAAAAAEEIVSHIRRRLDAGLAAEAVDGTVPSQLESAGVHVLSVSDGLPREPIARFVYQSAHDLSAWWNQLDWATPWKILLLVGIGLTVLANSGWLLPLAAGLGVTYLVYLLIRSWFVKESVSLPRTVYRPRPTEEEWRLVAAQRLASRDWAEQGAEVIGSLLKGAVACTLFAAAMFASGRHGMTMEAMAIWTWLALSSTCGVWIIVLTTRGWPWQPGDRWFRMGAMVAIGSLVGILCFALKESIISDPKNFAIDQRVLAPISSRLDLPGGARFVAAMAVLFGIIRWWWLSDPWRRARIGLWRVAVGVGLAIGISFLFGFQTWLPWMAGMTLVGVQLAAPWYHPEVKRLVAQATP